MSSWKWKCIFVSNEKINSGRSDLYKLLVACHISLSSWDDISSMFVVTLPCLFFSDPIIMVSRVLVVVMEIFLNQKFQFATLNRKNNCILWQSIVKNLLIKQGLYAILKDKKLVEKLGYHIFYERWMQFIISLVGSWWLRYKGKK